MQLTHDECLEGSSLDGHGTYMRGWKDGHRIGRQIGYENARSAVLRGLVQSTIAGLVLSAAVWAMLYFVG